MKYCYSESEEHFDFSCECDTREAAIAEAIGCLGIGAGCVFYLGKERCLRGEAYGPDADGICEEMFNGLYDEVGEACDGWPDASKEQYDELTANVRTTIKAWLDKHSLQPRFCAVDEIEEVRVTAELLRELGFAEKLQHSEG